MFIRGNKIVIRMICPISQIGDGRSSSKTSSINVLDYFELRNQLSSLIPENDLAAIFCVTYSLSLSFKQDGQTSGTYDSRFLYEGPSFISSFLGPQLR